MELTSEKITELRSKIAKKSRELSGSFKTIKEASELVAEESGFENGSDLLSAINKNNNQGRKPTQVKRKGIIGDVTCHLDDERLIDKVRAIYKEYGEISISEIQRRFEIGYPRASRVYNKFVARGIPVSRRTVEKPKTPTPAKASASLVGRYRKLCETSKKTIPSDALLSIVMDSNELSLVDCRKVLQMEGFRFEQTTSGDFRIISRPKFKNRDEALTSVMSMPHEDFWKLIQIGCANKLI